MTLTITLQLSLVHPSQTNRIFEQREVLLNIDHPLIVHVFCIVLKDLNTPLSPSPVHKKEVLYWFCFPSPLQRKVMCSPISLLLQLLHPNLNRPDSRPDSLWKPVFSYYDRLKGNFSRIKINTSSQTVTYFFSFWMTVPPF